MADITIELPLYARKKVEQEKRQMNNVSIDLPAYARSGTWSIWEDGYTLSIEVDRTNAVVIKGNKAGLISLARHLLTLSQDDYPIGSHIHYDAGSSLEDDSYPLIVDKIPEQDSIKQDDGAMS